MEIPYERLYKCDCCDELCNDLAFKCDRCGKMVNILDSSVHNDKNPRLCSNR